MPASTRISSSWCKLAPGTKSKFGISVPDNIVTPLSYIELDDSQSPKPVKAILDNLPIEVKINKWGDELYTERTPIIAEENAQSIDRYKGRQDLP
jgi:hypothetical protein